VASAIFFRKKMMGKSSINVDLDDPRIGKIADVISNKTAKSILGELAESGNDGLSESEISEKIGGAANTVHYNVKKLEEAGLIEKVSGFLWSVKGKRIYKYRVSNRKIVISPRTGLKGVLPAVLISGLIALGIRTFVGFEKNSRIEDSVVSSGASESASLFAEKAGDLAVSAGREAVQEVGNTGDIAAWFFLGALTGLLVFILWSWYSNVTFSRRKGNGSLKGGSE
jgi:DNA-binding Lrp family transcriptional regulator